MPRGPFRSAYGESRMLSEYLAWQYPDATVYERMRLGALIPRTADPTMTAEELAMVGVFRRWADAVVVSRDELVVVEAKMRSAPGAVAQLELYEELVPLTPELVPFLSLPLVLELVVAIEDPAVRRLCERKGIRCRIYKPDWLPVWVSALHRNEARPPRDFAAEAREPIQ